MLLRPSKLSKAWKESESKIQDVLTSFPLSALLVGSVVPATPNQGSGDLESDLREEYGHCRDSISSLSVAWNQVVTVGRRQFRSWLCLSLSRRPW